MELTPQMQAADPTTPPSVLHSLAAGHPELWVILAGNPALYPELREWLMQTGDVEVIAALESDPLESTRRRSDYLALILWLVLVAALTVLVIVLSIQLLARAGELSAGTGLAIGWWQS